MSIVVEDVPRCSYVLVKKKRKCRMLVKPGNLFCGEHAVHSGQNEDRIPCPNDPKHTVSRAELTQHLKRCNARLSEDMWIVKDLNSIISETKPGDKIDRRPLQEELEAVVPKLCKCYGSIMDRVEESTKETAIIEDYLRANPGLSDNNKKHLIQQGSIIGHLLSADQLKDDNSSCLFELGAGKAQLAYWMTKVAPRGKFLLVDRSGARNKYDNKALLENPSLNLERLRCSIEHLDLSKVELLKDAASLCAVCKHFCGSATDAGIRCLSNGISRGLPLCGFVLVPCCHHKSRYAEYCGRSFLEAWNLDNECDFAALRHIASWATCGILLAKDKEGTQVKDSLDVSRSDVDDTSLSKQESIGDCESDEWSPSWKEEMGRRAKVILEMGRAEHLNSLGFDTRVIRYVPSSISPENLLILGLKKVAHQ